MATNACLDAIARDERRAVLAARAAANEGWAGGPDDVVWLSRECKDFITHFW